MHDIADLESRGVPAAFVASTEFVEAAATQAHALGFDAIARVFVAHPIQDRTDDEMRALADGAFDAIVTAVTAVTAVAAVADPTSADPPSADPPSASSH